MIFLNGDKLEFGTFPNGETKMNEEQIKAVVKFGKLDEVDVATITLKYESDADLIKLLFVKSYLDALGIKSVLVISYMPYSRMDRSENGSAFTLKYLANKFINPMNFEQVIVLEPHSDVTTALIDNCIAYYPTAENIDAIAEMIDFDKEQDYLFFPDSGSEKRYTSKIKGYKHLSGHKKRDFSNGKIQSLKIVGLENEDVQGKKALIVDDLSSYGGTFLASAEQLKAIGFSEVYLWVTHCENSIFKGKLLTTDFVDKVFTTNTLLTTEEEHSKLHVFDII